MARGTQYEVYAIRGGAWQLAERFAAIDDNSARDHGINWHGKERAPCVVIEERGDSEGDVTAKIIWRSSGTLTTASPPEFSADLMPRLFLAAVCGVAAGAIGAVISGVVMAGARGSANGFVVILAFLAFAIGGALLAFRSAVPMELILWRNKSDDSRRKVIELLASSEEDESEEPPPPGRTRHSSSAAKSEATAHEAAPPETPAPTSVAVGADILRTFILNETEKLKAFADQTTANLMTAYPELTSFQRYGFNLWLAGALIELTRRDSLTPATVRDVLIETLVQTGTARDSATAFHSRLDDAQSRPRFKKMLDAGQAAFAAQLDEAPVPDDRSPTAMMQFWSSSAAGTQAARTATLLLTDMVGSTAMTGKLGNAGAQRVVRAHNAIVRAAVKTARGTEIKHTGDGILASFDTPVHAAQAAIEIQQETTALVRASPDLPLAIRIGLHEGEVIGDGDDLFGAALGAVDDVCAAGETGNIVATETVRQKSAGTIYKYAPLPEKTVAVDDAPVALFKLTWEPKRALNVPPIEYRHIGGRSPDA